jgi:Fe2+ transport system protein B
MLITILLFASLSVNIAVLVLMFVLFKKNSKASVSVDSELQNIMNTRKQIEFLQTKFKESLEEVISKNGVMIESTSNNLIKYYQDTITTLTLNYNQNSEKLMQVLNEELRKKVADLAALNAKQLEESKNLVTDEVKKEVVAIQGQVDKYTKEKFAEVDKKVYEIISETAKNTVGKVINIVDHQQLVMNALDAAKKDKFLS